MAKGHKKRQSFKKHKHQQILDSDDNMDIDDQNHDSDLQSKAKKLKPPVKPTCKKPGRPSKTDQKARTDPIPDDQDNIATSQFLRPVTPPNKAGKKDTTANQYTPQTAQMVQFSMQTSIWQIPVVAESVRQPRHGTADSSEMRPLNMIKQRERDGWKCLGKTGTAVLYKLFQDWENGYSPQEYKISSRLVSMQFFGHPCDRPKEICLLQNIRMNLDLSSVLSINVLVDAMLKLQSQKNLQLKKIRMKMLVMRMRKTEEKLWELISRLKRREL
ncbi:uncharacterized protein LACBIDRAFT_315425 [Laccaria bicolor S238N-H82]|uniref:Predicted protein n=1 Tax=Laccaria bicolor (strain S238N-H82 / ATCC MYA-4686) TaxID=486041 RepID=B0D2C7_LACBS|nr:uncharacterized protein LACBIDRAFT_315425 [Laccaria bicolor S238N-H82]EDR10724.1 predicted protein [Laccaria bicolor S238N-H82]|eukprot:XP_001878025.1 predicted protein [Laccaria bicolor S238N-H82]